MLFEDPTVSWPEIGNIRTVDAEEELKLYEMRTGNVWCYDGPLIVSLPEGDEHCMEILEPELNRDKILCISVRRVPGLHTGWWSYLEFLAKKAGIGVVSHSRHEVNEMVAQRLFSDALRALDDCADLVRGEGIDASAEAMRTEKALTRAIEALRSTGFRAPPKK